MAGVIFSKASGMADSVFHKNMESIMMTIEKKAEAFEQQSSLPHMFKMEKTENAMDKLTGLTSMGDFSPVGEGGATPKTELLEGPSKVLESETWKNSFEVTREMAEDAKSINLNNKPAGFVSSYYRTRERFGAAIYAGAVTGTTASFNGRVFNCMCADGKSVFDKEHPSMTGAKAQSNKFEDAFSVETLGKIETRMQNFADEKGNILAVAPDTIIIPNDYALKQAVFSAIGADKDPATSNNGFNYQYGRWTVVVNPYLNQYLAQGVTPYILLDSNYNNEVGGAVWLDRIKLAVHCYVDENTDNNIWKGRGRFIAGFYDWRAMAVGGITGATKL